MKKNLTRILAVLLIAMMLIPTLATFAVSAEVGAGETTGETIDISDIVNVYKLKKLDAAPNTDKVEGAMNADPTEDVGMLASEPFQSTRTGDKYVYVGPCPDPATSTYNDPILYWYKKNGAHYGIKKIGELAGDVADGGNVVDRFPDGSVILRIKNTSSTNNVYAAIRVPSKFADYMLVTTERAFTVADYYAYADAQGWAIEDVGLRIPPPAVAEEKPEGHEGLWNLFQSKEEQGKDALTQKSEANVRIQSNFIKVEPGDKITMGAISTQENQVVLETYDSEFNVLKKYKKGDIGINFVDYLYYTEDKGNDYAIYSHVIPEAGVDKDGNPGKEVAYVKVFVPSGIYNKGDILVTKNQDFTVVEYREMLEIPEPSAEVKAHAFYGKTALFIGDSVTYGDYDTPATYSTPSTGFARRLALATGLVPSSYSAAGATVGKTGKPNVKYEWDLLKTALMGKKTYDMVVFQGGINDAIRDLAVGEALPATTGREVLVENARVATFAGGLQLMFYDAIVKWPQAEFYYIANHKVDAAATNNKDMGEYYAQAKALCAAYGVHYIDLYNDAELNQILTENADNDLYADDNFTPVESTYDLIAPAVIRLFNASLNENLVKPDLSQSDEPETTPTTPEDDSETEPEGPSIGLIIGIAAAGVVVLAGGGFAVYWFAIRKKAPKAKVAEEAPVVEETKAEEEPKTEE